MPQVHTKLSLVSPSTQSYRRKNISSFLFGYFQEYSVNRYENSDFLSEL
ncbi:MAG: hypothetical protein LBT96_03345 [Campylobacteraceae bacterium]|nr:hypothetical protein [Campylobacteraceae bacterium]